MGHIFLFTESLAPRLEASQVAQMIKNLPAMQDTWVQSLGLEDSPGGGNGSLLRYSWLKNPMDRGAWRATVHGVTKSQTTTERLTLSLFTAPS